MAINLKGRADHIDQLVSIRLKRRRMTLGLSQQDLSDAVKVSIQQIQKYEKGTNRISSGKLHTFGKILKVPINYFFDQGEDSSNMIGSIVAEDSENYSADEKDVVTEKEIITLVKAFSEIKNHVSRKKVIELVKTMS